MSGRGCGVALAGWVRLSGVRWDAAQRGEDARALSVQRLPGADLPHRRGPIAGTIFASTKLALRVWFRALYHLTQTKQGISSIELGRRLGVTQTTAWKLEHKLGQVMLERDSTKRLSPYRDQGASRSTTPTSAANGRVASVDAVLPARRPSSPLSRRRRRASPSA